MNGISGKVSPPVQKSPGISGIISPTGVKYEPNLRHEIPTGVKSKRILGHKIPTGVWLALNLRHEKPQWCVVCDVFWSVFQRVGDGSHDAQFLDVRRVLVAILDFELSLAGCLYGT